MLPGQYEVPRTLESIICWDINPRLQNRAIHLSPALRLSFLGLFQLHTFASLRGVYPSFRLAIVPITSLHPNSRIPSKITSPVEAVPKAGTELWLLRFVSIKQV